MNKAQAILLRDELKLSSRDIGDRLNEMLGTSYRAQDIWNWFNVRFKGGSLTSEKPPKTVVLFLLMYQQQQRLLLESARKARYQEKSRIADSTKALADELESCRSLISAYEKLLSDHNIDIHAWSVD